MARPLKSNASQSSSSLRQTKHSSALPEWLSTAVICSVLEDGKSSNKTSSNQPPASTDCVLLRLEPRGKMLRADTKKQALSRALPGYFYFGPSPAPFPPASWCPEAFVFWLPIDVDLTNLHLIACSRLRRDLHDSPLLLDAIRSVAEAHRNPCSKLIYSPQFTLAAHLRATSRHFQIPLLQVSRIPARADAAWFRQRAKQTGAMRSSEIFYCCLSEFVLGDESIGKLPDDSVLRFLVERTSKSAEVIESPADWLAVHLARQVHLLSLRPKGNLDSAIRHRLRLPNQSPLGVRILESSQFTPSWLTDELVLAGAARWRLESNFPSPKTGDSYRTRRTSVLENNPLICDTEPGGEFLYHWTREPELSRHKAADQLFAKLLAASERRTVLHSILFEGTSDPCSIEKRLLSLLRILADMRLRASGRWTRDRRPVVSLTAQPLAVWRTLRSFRPHLGRWDFEPFGVGLSRALIQQLGGKPVVYGDEASYKSLPNAEQTFFQLAHSGSSARIVDWTIEREWRVPDDIDLRHFGINDAFVFVPNRKAAEVVANLSRWPIYALPEENLQTRGQFPGLQSGIGGVYNAPVD